MSCFIWTILSWALLSPLEFIEYFSENPRKFLGVFSPAFMGGSQAYSFEFGEFRLDPAERRLMRNGVVVPLTPKALELLCILVENGGHLLEKDRLMETLWADAFVEERKSTRLNSSHGYRTYAVFCLKKKTSMSTNLRSTICASCFLANFRNSSDVIGAPRSYDWRSVGDSGPGWRPEG